jgi:hypothetical protein
MLNEKVNYWSYLQLQQIKYQLHPIYGPSVNMILVIVVLPPIILIMIRFYKKKVLNFRTIDYRHTAQIIYQTIINVLHEYNLKKKIREQNIFNATVQLLCSYTLSANQLLQHFYLTSNVSFLFVFILISL